MRAREFPVIQLHGWFYPSRSLLMNDRPTEYWLIAYEYIADGRVTTKGNAVISCHPSKVIAETRRRIKGNERHADTFAVTCFAPMTRGQYEDAHFMNTSIDSRVAIPTRDFA